MELDYEEIYQITGTRLPVPDAEYLFTKALSIKPKIILEIGAAGGGSSIVLGTVAKQCGGHLWSIDPRPEGRWLPNIRRFELEDFVTLIVSPSPWSGADFLPGDIDFLFVDGDHRTTNCLIDFFFYAHYVKIGGLIAVHDVFTRNWRGHDISKWIGRALNILTEEYPMFERIEDFEGIKSRGGIALFVKTKDIDIRW